MIRRGGRGVNWRGALRGRNRTAGEPPSAGRLSPRTPRVNPVRRFGLPGLRRARKITRRSIRLCPPARRAPRPHDPKETV